MARARDLDQLQEALTAIGRLLNSRRARHRLEDRAGVPLAPTTIETLSAIRALGPVRHGAVASRIGIQPSRISKEVRALVQSGMVTETADPADRRAVLLDVTDKGVDALTRYVAGSREILDEALADWTATDLARLGTLLGRLAGALSTELLVAEPDDRTETSS